MKHISLAFLHLACTCPLAQSQEPSIGTPAANPLAGDVVADDRAPRVSNVRLSLNSLIDSQEK